jgi:hypothetical protein
MSENNLFPSTTGRAALLNQQVKELAASNKPVLMKAPAIEGLVVDAVEIIKEQAKQIDALYQRILILEGVQGESD